MSDLGKCKSLSIFKPRGKTMRGEVRVIRLVLAGWLVSILGFQIFVYLLEINYSELLLNDMTFFNLPVHFWLTGQLLPLWFIILCALFNIWLDRHSLRSMSGALRFTVPGAKKDEEE